MGIIYRITNCLNEKAYVGKTIRELETRWKHHVADAKRGRTDMLISKSIRKYGAENFKVEILGEYENELLNEAEKCWIRELGTFGRGYNLTLGGEGTLGYTFSEESRKKMSEKAKARGVSAKTIEKIAQINRGRKMTQEQLSCRIGKKRGTYKKMSQKARDEMSATRKGKKRSKSFVDKISRRVEQLDDMGNVMCVYTSLKAAAQEFGLAHTTIRGYIIGRIKNPRYVLRYAEERD